MSRFFISSAEPVHEIRRGQPINVTLEMADGRPLPPVKVRVYSKETHINEESIVRPCIKRESFLFSISKHSFTKTRPQSKQKISNSLADKKHNKVLEVFPSQGDEENVVTCKDPDSLTCLEVSWGGQEPSSKMNFGVLFPCNSSDGEGAKHHRGYAYLRKKIKWIDLFWWLFYEYFWQDRNLAGVTKFGSQILCYTKKSCWNFRLG